MNDERGKVGFLGAKHLHGVLGGSLSERGVLVLFCWKRVFVTLHEHLEKIGGEGGGERGEGG